MSVLYIFLGGGLGAACRYGLSLMPVGMDFPAMTLLTNLVGALVIGAITELAAIHGTSGAFLLFWKTGFCGGFTTFSTFSLETVTLFYRGDLAKGFLYIFLSVGLCLLGVLLGMGAVRGVLK